MDVMKGMQGRHKKRERETLLELKKQVVSSETASLSERAHSLELRVCRVLALVQ